MINFLRHLIFCDEIATITSDDDFYVYQSNHEFEDSTIQIHEVYAISESSPWQVLKYGLWNRNSGLVAANVAKWIRRKDLQVCKLQIEHGVQPINSIFYRDSISK